MDIPAGQICSWYSGCIVPAEGEGGVDDRDTWDLNDNVMSLEPGVSSIDVPPSYSAMSQYCASLGHKANHAHPPFNNCRYDPCVHPRFGNIKCVRATRAIKKNEELTTNYGYMNEEAPPWWVPRAEDTKVVRWV